jgi:CheY-like chemotaxis protein
MAMPRVLCVDDEPNVLEGVARNLRKEFDVTLAVGSAEGLGRITDAGPFAVVVSDLRMPGMDGITFLERVRELSPSTSRILLTGNADVSAAIDAVNRGNLFRFLTKPCPRELLVSTLQAAAEHHRLLDAERELLQKTLHGTVRLLTDALALANPATFGRIGRVTERARSLAAAIGIRDTWKVELAAMMSRVAWAVLAPETTQKLQRGKDLTDEEQATVRSLPEISARLLKHIPRIDDVQAMVAGHWPGAPAPSDRGARLGAQVLRAVGQLELSAARGQDSNSAVAQLRSSGEYDAAILEHLPSVAEGKGLVVRNVKVEELRIGMVLMKDLLASDGTMLVSGGQEVTVSLIERLRNFSRNRPITDPIEVGIRPE